ncbi:MAG: DUF4136 domain-containing protein [Gemmatimonadota bacterium]
MARRAPAVLALALVAVGSAMVTTTACYPGSITAAEETDVVLTYRDTAVDFGLLGTYVMPDSVVRVTDGEGLSLTSESTALVDREILSEVETQLSALGWRRVSAPAEGSPDVVVLVTVNTTDLLSWTPDCWWCQWGWYPWGPEWGWGWGPGYGPDYPWPPDAIETRKAGTLLVGMLEPVSTGTDIPVYWAGVANGLLSTSTEVDLARLEVAIGQMFDQSPYLDASQPALAGGAS